MVNISKLDFSGQHIYVGLDVHKKHWSVCILTHQFEHKTFNLIHRGYRFVSSCSLLMKRVCTSTDCGPTTLKNDQGNAAAFKDAGMTANKRLVLKICTA